MAMLCSTRQLLLFLFKVESWKQQPFLNFMMAMTTFLFNLLPDEAVGLLR
jgi:hypothetical protein